VLLSPLRPQATKLFVSNLNARLAQRFLALVLLPRVRHEIRTQQKLHFALFMALKKATYKPGAFYKVGRRGGHTRPGRVLGSRPVSNMGQGRQAHETHSTSSRVDTRAWPG
jgi:hypothetical protein